MATALELQHFAVLGIAYTHYPTGLYICTKTNNPCHLTCYYTDKEPVRHATSRVVRGLTLPWGAYWCFVAWNSVEQQEDGDTLIHTFEIPDWSYCQTKWLTFRGTVSDILSPSVTALLKHHHPGGLPMNIKLAVYWPGDICSTYLDGTGPPCPDHWKSVTTLPGYDPDWYLVGNTINRWWGHDSYLVEKEELGKILAVHHWLKAKRLGNRASPWVHRHLLRIAGTTYHYSINHVSTDWEYLEHIWYQNPHTTEDWTQEDLDNLQPGVGLRHTWGIGFGSTGCCDEVYIIVERGINCPP